MVLENVKGAQPWVGRARAHFGPFYLWGDVESVGGSVVMGGAPKFGQTLKAARLLKGRSNFHFFEQTGLPSPRFSGAEHESSVQRHQAIKTVGHVNIRDGHTHTRHLTNQAESDRVVKGGGVVKQHGSGETWFDIGIASHGSQTSARKAASAQIAEIPITLSRYIARSVRTFKSCHS